MTQPSRTLAAALAAMQAKMPVIEKGRTATVVSQKGSYKYSYAGLDDVARILQPLLAEFGFSFTSRPTLDPEGRFVLAYSLLHVSGESLDGAYPLPPNTAPQAVGSVITYARRYALCAVTGAVATEDDDGQAASTVERPAPRRAASPRKAAANVHHGGTSGDDRPRLPDNTRRKLMALFGQIGLTGDKDDVRAERLRLASAWIGRDLPTSNDLTPPEAALVISALEARIAEPPAGHDDGPADAV
jgi:hypothetical protein